MYAAAREFDNIMFNQGEEFASVGVLAAATQPKDTHHLGTMGIKANIERWRALHILRRNAAKVLGLDVQAIHKVSYRAANLNIIKQTYGTN